MNRSDAPRRGAATPLVGRDDAVREVLAAVAAHRVVTIVGTAGVGKTRVAAAVVSAVASEVEAGLPHAGRTIVSVDLEPVVTGSLVATVIALAVSGRIAAGTSACESLVRALGSQRVLLVLDGCERFTAEVERIGIRLLAACPNLTLLCTGRQRLGIANEFVCHLPGLPATSASPPDVSLSNDAREAASPAVMLFLARARAVDPTFRGTERALPSIARICRRLDGVPLAIELAAPRVRVVSIAKIAQTFDDRFGNGPEPQRTVGGNEASVHIAIAASYGHLTFDERLIFGRVAVFADAWDVDDAVAICCSERIGRAELLEVLDDLVDKSLIAVRDVDADRRFFLHPTIRAFARRRLNDAGEVNYCEGKRVERLLTRLTHLAVERRRMPCDRWEREMLHIAAEARAALTWALETERDVALGLRLVTALESFYTELSPREGAHVVAAALQLAEAGSAAPVLVAPLWLLGARLAEARRDSRAVIASATRAQRAFLSVNDNQSAAVALSVLSCALRRAGKLADALRASLEAVETLRPYGDHRATATATATAAALRELARVRLARGEDAAACAAADEADRIESSADGERDSACKPPDTISVREHFE